MSSFAELQSAKIIAPRTGEIIKFALDNTSRIKDVGGLTLRGIPVAKGGAFILTCFASVAWWYRTSPTASGTVDENAYDAAGAALTLQANAGISIQAYQPVDITFDRVTDRYLIIKGSAAGLWEGWPSSEIMGDSA